MNKRPWIPIAVVLLVLLGATLLVGRSVRSRLSEAELALAPFIDQNIMAVIGDGADFPTPPCGDADAIAETLRGFYDAVEVDRQAAVDAGSAPPEISTTDPTFDSFLLESAIARLDSGNHQVLLRARPGSDGWCVEEADFTTEK